MSISFGTLGRKKQKTLKAALKENSEALQTTESELDSFLKSIKAVPSEEEINQFLREIKAIPEKKEIDDFLIRIKAQDENGKPMLYEGTESSIGLSVNSSSSVFAGESIDQVKRAGTFRIKEDSKRIGIESILVKN